MISASVEAGGSPAYFTRIRARARNGNNQNTLHMPPLDVRLRRAHGAPPGTQRQNF